MASAPTTAKTAEPRTRPHQTTTGTSPLTSTLETPLEISTSLVLIYYYNNATT